MPLDALPTTVDALTTAFKTAINGITPRIQRGRVNEWKYHPRPHDPLMGTRWYRFEWTMIREDTGIQTNAIFEQKMEMMIVTDYGAIPEQELDAIAHDDHLQLEGVLDALRTSTNGLRRVLSEDWDHTTESQLDQAQIAHVFSVRYLQAKV